MDNVKFKDHVQYRATIFMHRRLPRCIIPITCGAAPELVNLGWDTGLSAVEPCHSLLGVFGSGSISRSVGLALAWALSNMVLAEHSGFMESPTT